MYVHDIMDRYTKRWQCEIDYFYLKTRLGLSDFRVRSALAIKRYICIIHFVDVFLQYRQILRIKKRKKYVPLYEIIESHRNEHNEKTTENTSTALGLAAEELKAGHKRIHKLL